MREQSKTKLTREILTEAWSKGYIRFGKKHAKKYKDHHFYAIAGQGNDNHRIYVDEKYIDWDMERETGKLVKGGLSNDR